MSTPISLRSKNKVLALGYGNNPIYGYGNITKTEVGREVGELYGWLIDGIFQNKAEIDALNAKSPTNRYQEELHSVPATTGSGTSTDAMPMAN